MALTFADFLAKFPPITMPATLGEDTHHTFGTENMPLSDALIAKFIHPVERVDADDEFTEYLPCFAIDNTEQFIALVWWKATLLNYEYVLSTFQADGQLISRQVIGFTRVERDGSIHRAVATINEEYEILIAEGRSSGPGDAFDPTTSRTRHVEIMANGEIIEY